MKSRANIAQLFVVYGLPLLAAVVLCLSATTADAATIKTLRLWRAPDNTRLVFDLSGPVEHKLFDTAGEKGSVQRLVVTIDQADFTADLGSVNLANTPISHLSHNRSGNGEQVVIDLKARVKPKSFLLPANEQYGARLVLDLFDEDKQSETRVVKTAANGMRDIVVAIDAGHGGEDPGAKGPGGLYEKNVTLAIAKELAQLINKTPGYSAFLTRTGDYFISLRGRTQIARNKSADLFVSIHADAFNDKSAQGASVFALSQRGATSETARWLEKQENDADLVGGVNLADKDPMLQGVLLDLSMTSTIANSLDMGDDVLGQIGKITRLHRGYVEQAGFVVLKNPDIPSLLVETGFITNAQEAKNLSDPAYRSRMARAVFTGIDSHFRKKPPMDTALAAARGGQVPQAMDKVPQAMDKVPQAMDKISQAEDKTAGAVDSKPTDSLAKPHEPTLDDAIAEEERSRNKAMNDETPRTKPDNTTVTIRRDNSAAENAAREEDALQKMLDEKTSKKTTESAKTTAVKMADSAKSKTASAGKKSSPKTREHVVSKGETLSGIASRYKVSVVALRDQNKLPDQNVRIGQKLRIPVSN